MRASADAATGLSPWSFLGACSEVYSKLRPQEDADERKEVVKPGQDHLFTFYNDLSDEEKRQLDSDYDLFRVEDFEEAWTRIAQADFNSQSVSIDPPRVLNWELKRPPTPCVGANLSKCSDVSERKISMWRSLGMELYFKNRMALVIMSGGKDSRMGDGVPKGVLDIGLLSGKSIFQLYFERVIRLQHLVQRKFKRAMSIPIYIMCNTENRGIIEEFFHENNFFGIREQDVLFFTQANFPVCDGRGKILLRERHKIAQEPNGNGGLFKALLEEGMISDMKSRGVTNMFVGSVDNVLGKIGDPVFLGYCEACKAEVGLKCIEKVSPEELFGVFATKTTTSKDQDVDGDGKADEVSKVRASVVEFFELPEELKKRRSRSSTGVSPLVLNSGNISQYYFKVDFVKRVHSQMAKRWHAIPKAMNYVNIKTGKQVVVPESGEKNARRLEMFVFDCFDFAKSVVGLEVDRSEFANIKNVTGPHSPQTALVAMGRLHQQWILAAGGKFIDQRIATEREDTKCEISPLVSYAGEDLGGQFPTPLHLPFYMPSRQELLQFSAASSAQTRRASQHFLDWYSDLSQRELEIELNQQLGSIMDAIEDPHLLDYMGERAPDEELLPATPRRAASMKITGRGEPSGHSHRGGSKDEHHEHHSQHAKSKDTAGHDAAEHHEDNALPSGHTSTSIADLEDRKSSKATAASRSGRETQTPAKAAPSKPGTKAREAFWGEEAAKAAAAEKAAMTPDGSKSPERVKSPTKQH